VLTRRAFQSLLAKQPDLEERVSRALEERLRATADESI
jgi:CRP-like cAMP-binding protein